MGGFLDVCCKDPDFIPPPPPKIKYASKCGRRNQNGLGVRIQGFTESESQFGEWPHMCAILHEKPIEQEVGYGGEPQTVNLYQCGGSLIAPGVIMTDMFRHSTLIQNLTDAIFRMTLLSSSHLKTLSSPATLTPCVFLRLVNCLMEPPALPPGGGRTSLDPQDTTKLSSRRLIFQL